MLELDNNYIRLQQIYHNNFSMQIAPTSLFVVKMVQNTEADWLKATQELKLMNMPISYHLEVLRGEQKEEKI